MDGTAIIQAAAARALIRAMGMQATNAIDERNGEPPTYREGDFTKIIEDEGIGHNAVLGALGR